MKDLLKNIVDPIVIGVLPVELVKENSGGLLGINTESTANVIDEYRLRIMDHFCRNASEFITGNNNSLAFEIELKVIQINGIIAKLG